jgi:hypothetical protein
VTLQRDDATVNPIRDAVAQKIIRPCKAGERDSERKRPEFLGLPECSTRLGQKKKKGKNLSLYDILVGLGGRQVVPRAKSSQDQPGAVLTSGIKGPT